MPLEVHWLAPHRWPSRSSVNLVQGYQVNPPHSIWTNLSTDEFGFINYDAKAQCTDLRFSYLSLVQNDFPN